MLSWALLLAIAAAFLAGTVTGMTGFGLALISTPLLLFVYGPKTVIVLTAIFSIFINAAVVLDSLRDADKRLALALLVPALVGIFVGAEILRTVDAAYIRLAVGIVVIFSALLLLRDIRLPGADSRWGTVVAGSTSGALSTSTGLAGPPIVLLLAALFLRGLVEGHVLPLAAILIPAAIVGKALGTAILKKMSEGTFRTVSLGLVIFTGALGVATALWALL